MALSSDEADRIAAAGLPVLCIDTCSLLDIIRDPSRETALPHNAAAAMAIVQMMESGSAVTCLLADQVRQELATHQQSVTDEATRGMQKICESIKRVDGLVSAFSPPVRTDIRHWRNHVANASALLQRWIGSCVAAPESSEVKMRACNRALQARAPARKGKDSLADCVVLETYIEAAAQLRQRGMKTPIVLLSSNVQDYTAPPSRSVLHPDLQSEFNSFGVAYATGFGMAKSLLKLI